MTSRWERLWFVPESPLNLAAARVIFAAHALWLLLSRDLAATSALPAPFWSLVPRTSLLRYLIFPGHPGLERGLVWLTIATLTCALLGLAPRVACFASGILLYHIAPLETIFWSTNPYERDFSIAILAFITLAAAPCGDALTPSRRAAPPRDPADYGWALRLCQFYVASVYLIAGIAKLRRVGVVWIAPENQRRWLLVFNQEEQVRMFHSIGPWLADHRPSLWAMGIGAMVIDLGFVLCVFVPRLRKLFVPAAVLGHVGIALALNIFFINVPQLLVFVNWTWLRERFGRRAAALAPAA